MSAELIDRLEKLTGPCREVDADIYIALNIPAERVGRIDRLGGCVGWWPKDAPYESAIDVPTYTASLDAAVALVERCLPDWTYCIRPTFVELKHPTALMKAQWGVGPTPAIALLLALFRALEAEGARDE